MNIDKFRGHDESDRFDKPGMAFREDYVYGPSYTSTDLNGVELWCEADCGTQHFGQVTRRYDGERDCYTYLCEWAVNVRSEAGILLEEQPATIIRRRTFTIEDW